MQTRRQVGLWGWFLRAFVSGLGAVCGVAMGLVLLTVVAYSVTAGLLIATNAESQPLSLAGLPGSVETSTPMSPFVVGGSPGTVPPATFESYPQAMPSPVGTPVMTPMTPTSMTPTSMTPTPSPAPLSPAPFSPAPVLPGEPVPPSVGEPASSLPHDPVPPSVGEPGPEVPATSPPVITPPDELR